MKHLTALRVVSVVPAIDFVNVKVSQNKLTTQNLLKQIRRESRKWKLHLTNIISGDTVLRIHERDHINHP
jgi:hypothetical protein